MGGGILVAFLVAFVAHRIAQSQRERSRWLLIFGCGVIAAAGVVALVQWANAQGSDVARLKSPPSIVAAEATSRNDVYYRKEELDNRYAQQSAVAEMREQFHRRLAEANQHSKRLEEKLASLESGTSQKLTALESRSWTPDHDRKIARQLAELEDQVDRLRGTTNAERQRVARAYSPTLAQLQHLANDPGIQADLGGSLLKPISQLEDWRTRAWRSMLGPVDPGKASPDIPSVDPAEQVQRLLAAAGRDLKLRCRG